MAIVEDDAPVRTALRRLLRSAGYAVVTFDGGDEFISSLAHVRPDCVVIDLVMPAMNGVAVLERILGLGHSCPAIVITGNVDSKLDARAFDAGAKAVLRKPVDDQALLDALASVFLPPATNDGT